MAHATTALRVRCIASPLNPSAPVAPRPVTTTLIPKTKTAYGVNPAKTEAALALSKRLNAALKVAKRTTTQTKGSTSTVAAMSTWDSVDVEEGKKCLDFEEYFVLDVRSAKEYDFERLTKPTRRSQNVPAGDGFAARVASTYPKSAKLLVMCRDGVEASPAVMDVLVAEGYTGAVLVQGGFDGWTEVFSTSGRRKPPKGRWVPSGTEALKSGLGVGEAAATYEEGGHKGDGKTRLLP